MLEGLWVKENKKVIITNVYAPCDLQGKRNQWEEILHLKSSYQNELWCILGDFNSIRNQNERLSSSQNSVNSSSIAEFNSWISLMAVEEVRSIGRKYTWFRPNGSVMSKLDRFFISDSWLIQWPDTTQFVLDRDFSDHCPILLRSNFVDWGPKPFKVLDWWLQDKGFQDMVALKWSNYHPYGWGGFALKQKLKFIKGCIRQWSSSNGVINVKKIQDLKKELNALEVGISDRIMNQSEVDLKKSLQEQLWHASNAYESMLRQKARVKWLKEGDINSAYFHNMLNHRRRHNAIQGLIIDGEWVQDPSRVKNEALNHFKDRFSEQNFNRPTLDGVLLPSLGQSTSSKLTPLQLESLLTEGTTTRLWLVEFRSSYSPACIRSSQQFPELSITYSSKNLSFGIVDLGLFPNAAERFGISLSGSMGQLPTFILFENAAEVARFPELDFEAAYFHPKITKGLLSRHFELDRHLLEYVSGK
ncbi:Thioredoxin-related transmembrane protein 2 [Glycine soja]